MQHDLFDNPKPEVLKLIDLQEHRSSNYGPRTGENARGAVVTVAFAKDFSTAGEKLTHSLAGQRYVGIAYGSPVAEAANSLLDKLIARKGTTLNVAGNGIYTMHKHGVTQAQANQWVYEVLKLVHSKRPLTQIRSGGQTGIDVAGLVAGIALGIPVLGLWPKGFKQRTQAKQDVLRDKDTLLEELKLMADTLIL